MQLSKLVEHLKSIQQRISLEPTIVQIQSAVIEVSAIISNQEGPFNEFFLSIKTIPNVYSLTAGPRVIESIDSYISYLSAGFGNQNIKIQQLGEVEDLLRTAPEQATIRHETAENIVWLGRLSAVIKKWDPRKSVYIDSLLAKLRLPLAKDNHGAFTGLLILLNEARSNLRFETVGPLNIAIEQGAFFDYFDEVRKIIQSATKDLFVIDPYLDADFISKYLSYARNGTNVRLLTKEKLATLLPAVEAFVNQYNFNISVHSYPGLHDRYIIVDSAQCFQSGASFKDGAKNAPTTLTAITDAFSAVLRTYEEFWSNGKVAR